MCKDDVSQKRGERNKTQEGRGCSVTGVLDSDELGGARRTSAFRQLKNNRLNFLRHSTG